MTPAMAHNSRICVASLRLCASAPLRCLVVRFIAITLLILVGCAVLSAQDTDKPAQPSGPSSADELPLEQSRLADKYAKLEQLMLKMSELEGLTNPKRAQLLMRAVEQSKEKLTKKKLDNLVN